MADDLNCRDAWGNLIGCNGTFYAPVDGWNNWWNDWEDSQDCPFWGDTSGIVDQWDCFD